MAFLKYCLPACALLVAACDPTPADTPLDINDVRPSVHAIVITGATTASAQVRSVDPRQNVDFTALNGPISGATVSLIREPSRTDLKEAPANMLDCVPAEQRNLPPAQQHPVLGCYAATLASPIIAGESYNLDVHLPGGGRVTGTTRALAALNIISPQRYQQFRQVKSGEFEDMVSIPIRWNSNPDYRAYQVVITSFSGFRNGAPAPNCGGSLLSNEVPVESTQDTASLRLDFVRCFDSRFGSVPWDSIRANVRVAVFDSAYARYSRIFYRDKVNLDEATAGITGALGVFGAGAIAEIPVTILPAQQ